MGEGLVRQTVLVVAGLLAAATAGCTLEATGFATDFHDYREASIRASTSEALVGSNGRCEGDVNIDPALLRGGSGEIRLGSSECEVVARLGGPYSVEIRHGIGGERVARLTYVSGAKVGVYVFTNNRLTAIER
jgi:hypothetical protein